MNEEYANLKQAVKAYGMRGLYYAESAETLYNTKVDCFGLASLNFFDSNNGSNVKKTIMCDGFDLFEMRKNNYGWYKVDDLSEELRKVNLADFGAEYYNDLCKMLKDRQAEYFRNRNRAMNTKDTRNAELWTDKLRTIALQLNELDKIKDNYVEKESNM